MIYLIYLAVYLVGIFAFCLWDSLIGMPMDWYSTTNRSSENPPLFVAAVLWPFFIPIVLLSGFVNFITESKQKRLDKEEAAAHLRFVLKQEQEAVLEQVNLEMQDTIKKRL